MKRSLPSQKVLLRQLHVTALMMKEGAKYNAEKLAKYFSFRSEDNDDFGDISSKTLRLDLQHKIQENLDISFETQKGKRVTTLASAVDPEKLSTLLDLYIMLTVEDMSRKIIVRKLVEKNGKSSMLLCADLHYAIAAKKKISFTYTTNSMKIIQCSMNPYYIMMRDAKLYLIGKRDKDGSVGMNIFDRIENIQVLEETFTETIPPVESYFTHSLSPFIWDDEPVTVTIRYPVSGENTMRDEFQHLNPEEKRFSDHFKMSFKVHDYEAVCRQLFFYGSSVEIVSPPEVRDYMIQQLAAAMSVYKKAD